VIDLAAAAKRKGSRVEVGSYTRVGRLPEGLHTTTTGNNEDAEEDAKVNEDALCVDPERRIFGIFDGNGKTRKVILEILGITEENWSREASQMGIDYDITTQFDPAEAARYLAQKLPHELDKAISDGEGMSGIRNRFVKVHRKMRERCIMGSASTAVLIHISSDARTLTLINCGDSRALICRNGEAIQLSKDHNPAQNFGSDEFSESTLYIHQEQLQPENDQFVVLVSDGVYNAFDDGNTDVVNFVRERLLAGAKVQTVAQQLVDHAYRLEEAKANPDTIFNNNNNNNEYKYKYKNKSESENENGIEIEIENANKDDGKAKQVQIQKSKNLKIDDMSAIVLQFCSLSETTPLLRSSSPNSTNSNSNYNFSFLFSSNSKNNNNNDNNNSIENVDFINDNNHNNGDIDGEKPVIVSWRRMRAFLLSSRAVAAVILIVVMIVFGIVIHFKVKPSEGG
jgi:serine/threonine protein phosphatase PrpC